MARSRLDPENLRLLGTIFEDGAPGRRSDAELLDQFARESRDETAFAVLVDRHRSMVLRACRGVLGDPHAAEDAAQVTFLVLAKKAGVLRSGETIAPWLFGVAVRVSAKMRVGAARRRKHERIGAERRGERSEVSPGDDLGPAVFEEVGRLPEKYRAPVVLCYFEGLSHDQAAGRLGWPVGTVRGRLARARDRLRGRLNRRGLSPSAGFLAALSERWAVLSPSTPGWAESTAEAACRFVSAVPGSATATAKGVGAGTAGAVPEALSRAAQEFLREMIMIKARMIGAMVLVSSMVAGGAVGLAQFGEGGGFGGGETPLPSPSPKVTRSSVSARVAQAEAAKVETQAPVSNESALPSGGVGFGGGGGAGFGGGVGFGGGGGGGFEGAAISRGRTSLQDQIMNLADDTEAMDALVEIALMDVTLAKMFYEKEASMLLKGSGISPEVEFAREHYIDAIVELAAIRSLMKERGYSGEDLPPMPKLEVDPRSITIQEPDIYLDKNSDPVDTYSAPLQ